MVEEFLRKTSKKTWYKWSFYLNIILFFIIAVWIYFVVNDAWNAGKWYFEQSSTEYTSWMFALARDVAILAVALSLIFVQLIRNISTIIRRSL